MVHADHPRFRDNLTMADFLAESHALVRLVDPPLKPPSFHLMQHWHTVVNTDSTNVWLRQMVKGLFND
jgi:hypothetical protein